MDGIKHHKLCVTKAIVSHKHAFFQLCGKLFGYLWVCALLWEKIQLRRTPEYGLMVFLLQELHVHLYSCVSLWVGSEYTYSSPGNTHDRQWLWGTADCLTSNANTAAGRRDVNVRGPLRERQDGLEASGRWCVVSSLESRRGTMSKLPCGFCASFLKRTHNYQCEDGHGKWKGPE